MQRLTLSIIELSTAWATACITDFTTASAGSAGHRSSVIE
jgi:hypothetical protein